MDQHAVNEAEWTHASNWRASKWLSVYVSKRDARVWVSKRAPAFGRTVNLGHPGGFRWFLEIIGGVVLALLAIPQHVDAIICRLFPSYMRDSTWSD